MKLNSFSMAICQNGDCSRYQHQSEPQLNTTTSCVNPLDLFCNSDSYISVCQKCDDIYSQQKQNKTFNSSKNGDIHTVFQSKNSDFSLKKIGCLYKSQLVSSLSFTNKLLLCIITINKGSGMLREVFYDGSIVRLKAWNTEVENGVFPVLSNSLSSVVNSAGGEPIVKDSNALSFNDIEIFGIALECIKFLTL